MSNPTIHPEYKSLDILTADTNNRFEAIEKQFSEKLATLEKRIAELEMRVIEPEPKTPSRSKSKSSEQVR